jgi:glycine cleavage system aminomethyltransferase T
MEKLFGGPVPEVKFFHIGDFTIAGRAVKGLRHGMAGQPGFEFFGPWADNEVALNALLAAGAEFDIRRVYLQVLDLQDIDHVEYLGSEVLPALPR